MDDEILDIDNIEIEEEKPSKLKKVFIILIALFLIVLMER